MRAKSINIKGINRQVGSPDNDDGYCSELINLKVQNGLKITGNKVVKSANIPYNRISIHKIGKIQNYIGVRTDADGIYIDHFNPDSGALVQNIATFKANSEIYYVLLNNQVVISDKTAIKEYVYQFSDSYKLHYSGIDLDFDITFGVSGANAQSSTIDLKAGTKDEYLAGVQSQINKFEVENPEYAEGYILCAFTVTFNDGTEDRMFGLQYLDPYRNSSVVEKMVYAVSGTSDSIKTRFVWSGYYGSRSITVREAPEVYERYKKLIKNINLYVSKPITKYPISIDKVTTTGMGWEYGDVGVTNVTVTIPDRKVKDSGLEKALLYKQKSWTLEEFCAKEMFYKFEFGGDKQVTGATMEVYGSDIERAGKMFAYNNRVHFYNTNARLKMKLGNTKYSPYNYKDDTFTSISAKATVIVRIKAAIEDLIFQFEDRDVILAQVDGAEYKLIMPDMTIFPDSRSYQADIIISSIVTGGAFSSLVGKKYILSLSASPAYNYSYFYGGPDNAVAPEGIFDGAYPELVDVYKETNAINVSSSGTPFVFPVANSYKFDGNITALAVAMQQISDAQVGQYPLNVFTDNGIFALEQGGGTVLYSNIVPLTADTCLNDSVRYTFQGIAYISNGAVYVLNGRIPTKMTAFLEGQPDVNIQNNESFLKCCGGELYDISDSLSQVDFKEYVNDAKLSWCANTNELIVSNSAYSYSYVYDFYFNAWYKVTGVYEAIEDNLILKPITLNNGNEAPASAKVTLSALHVEQTKQISVLSKASFSTTVSCGAGHTVAMLIDGTQVASAVFSQITYTPMMVSVLCESIGYLEDEPGTIYSKTDLASKTVRLYNISTGADIFSATFSATSESVIIADKAIGTKVTLTVDNTAYNEVFLASSSAVTLLNNLADKVNANDTKVYATVQGNTIVLTAKTAGSQGNNINVAVTASDTNYLYISTTAMTGGEDISLKPSSYKEIVDWSMEKPSAQQTIHLHTRPMSFGNVYGYKTIRRTVMSVMASLKGQENLSMYIFASDNLIDWKCVCAAQRKGCNISQITCDRSAKAHKYFILMIGGLVENNTQISTITMAIEDVVNKKLR